MAVNVNETEAKYDAPAGAAVPRLDGLPQAAGTSGPAGEQLEAEYYDTDDLRLIRAGVTLRRRRGGDDAGWHLKLPLGADTRREIRLPLGQAGRRVPGELADLVRVHTRSEPLRPVARLTTTRQRLILLGQAGESLAEVAADDVCAETLRGTTATSSWHEDEVELTGGDRELLKAADELPANLEARIPSPLPALDALAASDVGRRRRDLGLSRQARRQRTVRVGAGGNCHAQADRKRSAGQAAENG